MTIRLQLGSGQTTLEGIHARVVAGRDPSQCALTFDDPTLFLSMEDDRKIEVHPREIKQSYLEEFGRFLVETKQACRAADVDYELVRTDAPLDKVLLNFLGRRMGR